jgi:hypothetical protein
MTDRHPDEDYSDPAELPIVWGLFRALETACEGDGLPDSTVASLGEAAEAQLGVDGLLRGWALTAAVLRARLQEHAARVGCSCGSDEWLLREQIYNAEWAAGESHG